jgi:hypothetical protein
MLKMKKGESGLCIIRSFDHFIFFDLLEAPTIRIIKPVACSYRRKKQNRFPPPATHFVLPSPLEREREREREQLL